MAQIRFVKSGGGKKAVVLAMQGRKSPDFRQWDGCPMVG